MTTGIVPDWGDSIEVKNEDQIQGLRQACQLARHVLLLAGKSLKVASHQTPEGLTYLQTYKRTYSPFSSFPSTLLLYTSNLLKIK